MPVSASHRTTARSTSRPFEAVGRRGGRSRRAARRSACPIPPRARVRIAPAVRKGSISRRRRGHRPPRARAAEPLRPPPARRPRRSRERTPRSIPAPAPSRPERHDIAPRRARSRVPPGPSALHRSARCAMTPRAGQNPKTPQYEADAMTPPCASHVMARGTWQAPTAAAALPRGAPAVRRTSCGWSAGTDCPRRGSTVREPPIATAPASSRRSITAGTAAARGSEDWRASQV